MSKKVSKRYVHFCPHCGADATLRQSDADGYWYVACVNIECGCRSKSWHKAENAIDSWNQRLDS